MKSIAELAEAVRDLQALLKRSTNALKVSHKILNAHSEAIDANYKLLQNLQRRIEILELRLDIEEPKG